MLYLSWNLINTRNHHCWSLNCYLKKKKNYSPNDRFPIKFFIKIINLDSSQRVPPMSPCPRLIIIITRVPLINQPPWDFKTQILSNPMEFYETLIDFYGFQTISNFLWFRGRLFRGKLGKTWQGQSDLVGGEGGLINPMLALYGWGKVRQKELKW